MGDLQLNHYEAKIEKQQSAAMHARRTQIHIVRYTFGNQSGIVLSKNE